MTNIHGVRVSIYKMPWSNRVGVYIIRDNGQKVENFANGKWEEVKEGGDYNATPSALTLPEDIWQLFVDELTNEIKPTAKAEVDAELKATKYHLEDMRKLALKGE